MAFCGKRVNVWFRWDAVVEDAEVGQVVFSNCAARVVREALVALRFSSMASHCLKSSAVLTASLSNQYALILAVLQLI
jgi:hypothetical protein